MFNILQEIGIGTANTGERMEILKADGTSFTEEVANQPYLTVLGKDSTAFRMKQQDLAIELNNLRKDDEEYEDTIDDATQRTNRLLAACIVGWGNIAGLNGQPLEFNEDNALNLLNESPMLSDLVNVFVAKRANFLKKQ